MATKIKQVKAESVEGVHRFTDMDGTPLQPSEGVNNLALIVFPDSDGVLWLWDSVPTEYLPKPFTFEA